MVQSLDVPGSVRSNQIKTACQAVFISSLQGRNFPKHPTQPRLHAVQFMKTSELAACALIVLADLYSRRGAEVAVNVRPEEASEKELGAFICVPHAPQKPPRQLTSSTDEGRAKLLLAKVHETYPQAVLKWHENKTCWFIKDFGPRPRAGSACWY